MGTEIYPKRTTIKFIQTFAVEATTSRQIISSQNIHVYVFISKMMNDISRQFLKRVFVFFMKMDLAYVLEILHNHQIRSPQDKN